MLLIYLPQLSERCKYIFDHIFKNEFGIDYQITHNISEFENFAGAKINYSENKIGNEIFIKSSGLLFEKNTRQISVGISKINETTVLFPSQECDFEFDIFSAVFYLLSRYEEYLPFTPDAHNRFPVTCSIAYKNNFLQIPIVDQWILLFKKILQEKFAGLQFRNSKFQVLLTYDIDVAYKFKGRNFLRNTGSIIKDVSRFDFKNIKSRWQNKTDPWDTYAYLQETILQNKFDSTFFFLLSDISKYDRNLEYNSDVVKSLINTIKVFSDIGIHPSYYASDFLQKIKEEKERLQNIAGNSIDKSRMHFLKFVLPDTYNALLDAGIKKDYSMGYPYEPGFRAGTSKPFYFYDLKNENATVLQIFPVAMMDANFMHDKNFNAEKVSGVISTLIDEIKKVNGTFISIWHNHTVSDTDEYKEWRNLHDKMIFKLTLSI